MTRCAGSSLVYTYHTFQKWEHQALNEQSEPTEVVSLYYGGALKMHPVFCPLGHEPMLSYDIRGVCVREGASGLTSPPDSTGSATVLHSSPKKLCTMAFSVLLSMDTVTFTTKKK